MRDTRSQRDEREAPKLSQGGVSDILETPYEINLSKKRDLTITITTFPGIQQCSTLIYWPEDIPSFAISC